jgi:hypothetical protein
MSGRTAEQNDGYAWRILLGPSHDWPPVKPGTAMADQSPATERCEFCREPVDSSKPFSTNSAGEHPIHLACLNEDEKTASSGLFSNCNIREGWLRELLGVLTRWSGKHRLPAVAPVLVEGRFAGKRFAHRRQYPNG